MDAPLHLNDDRLFSADATVRVIARELYEAVRNLPIVSPHGHTDPSWFALNAPFENPAALLLQPDHYLLRMLYSQGISLTDLGIATIGDGDANPQRDAREIWRLFASNYYLFRGTPSRLWLDTVFSEVFGLEIALSAASADRYFDRISEALERPEFLPRALFERFDIEILATTESPLDSLAAHRAIAEDSWGGRVITTYRPDSVVDPEYENFAEHVAQFGELTGQDTGHWQGYLAAHRVRRRFFKSLGATATDHGHPSAATADLPLSACESLYRRCLSGQADAHEAEQFRAQVLTEMAGMSLEDGLVMQLHPGSYRNHNAPLFTQYGRDRGADIPMTTDYVKALRPLLNRYGNEAGLTLIVFTLDETSYSRELAPLAGHYPALRLGPAWWFHDSPEGMRRFREQVTETAGFYNTVGFNDDTRAFLSIPARHDMARRMDCNFLAQLVAEHRLPLDEAGELAVELSYTLAKRAYRL
ncbi:MAG: glucuronate isomerase [Pseudomonadota bacterium]